MQKFNVRSKLHRAVRLEPHDRLHPHRHAEQQARVAKIQQMTPNKIAPLAVYLLSDAARDVNAQVFAVRNNEIFVMSQPRPLRSVHRSEGWSPQFIAEHGMPALKASFVPLDRSADVFSWDPV